MLIITSQMYVSKGQVSVRASIKLLGRLLLRNVKNVKHVSEVNVRQATISRYTTAVILVPQYTDVLQLACSIIQHTGTEHTGTLLISLTVSTIISKWRTSQLLA